MHVFWQYGEETAADARGRLAGSGIERAYVTVANLVRILVDKGFLKPANGERPFRYLPTRSFEEVSQNLVRELMQRVFHGSREQLLVRVIEERKLSAKEKAVLNAVLKERKQ